MLNPESRKYFTRVFTISGSALGTYALWEPSHLEQVRKCSGIFELVDLIDYLKTANSTVLRKCYPVGKNRFRTFWLPTIESPRVVGAFLIKTAEEILRAIEAPVMDVLASVATQVYIS